MSASSPTGVNGLVVAPIDTAAIRPVLLRYRERRIPVVVVDNDPGDPSIHDALVIADNHAIGVAAGEFLAEVTGGQGSLVEILGIPVTSAARDRSAGFREVVARHPQMQVVDSCTGDWLFDRGRDELARLLPRHARIDAVFAQNDEMARGALEAAAAAGRDEEMLIVGVDALPGALGIRLVSQGGSPPPSSTRRFGREAILAHFALADGEPVLPRTLLKSSILKSNERIRAWQVARRSR